MGIREAMSSFNARETKMQLPRTADVCPVCRGVGWVLETGNFNAPVALELIACIYPPCPVSGQDISVLSLNNAQFGTATYVPSGRYVMSVSGFHA